MIWLDMMPDRSQLDWGRHGGDLTRRERNIYWVQPKGKRLTRRRVRCQRTPYVGLSLPGGPYKPFGLLAIAGSLLLTKILTPGQRGSRPWSPCRKV